MAPRPGPSASRGSDGANGPGPRPARILPVIVLSQFAGTSLWFAGNAVLPDLTRAWGLAPDALGDATAAVQFGFILGTLAFAFFAVADRWSPRIVFCSCALLGAACNLIALAPGGGLAALLGSRFLTGFFIAGIYPVGMKIAAGWYARDLGRALGLLVGALVLGTAFPHLLKALGGELPWSAVLVAVSALAAGGGAAMLALVPDGPHLARGAPFDARAIATIFRSRGFRASAFGYFGHMWELYAFWAFVPVAIAAQTAARGGPPPDVSLWSFWVIAAGFAGCALGGLVSLRTGSAPVAAFQLGASGVCCLVSPLVYLAPTPAFLAFLVFWGVVVVGDSPQFSTLNARNAPPDRVGSALTIANCIGFAITIGSIQLLNALAVRVDPAWLFLALAPGPALGMIALRPLLGRGTRNA